MKLTSKYQTIATVGYSASICVRRGCENQAAHGGVCHLQARISGGRIIGRKINSNGRHTEVGTAGDMTADQLAHWETLACCSR